mmetsp:Transcript_3357/g.8355  ORF Transcript_3357/g.8355 Transcript_3357/m.8355 type:complete len:214 (+) Transcript_3357:173-814(+)
MMVSSALGASLSLASSPDASGRIKTPTRVIFLKKNQPHHRTTASDRGFVCNKYGLRLHLELEHASDIRVQLNRALVDADLANIRQGDGLLVHLLARLLLDGVHHVRSGDAAEDLPILAHGLLHGKFANGGQRSGDGPGPGGLGVLGCDLHRRRRLHLGEDLGGGLFRLAHGLEVVAPVSEGHLHDVSCLAQLGVRHGQYHRRFLCDPLVRLHG